jgi:hypothetical protein
MSPLGKKVEAAKPAPAPKEAWRPHRPGIEINQRGQLRTVDIDTAAQDYARELAKRIAP